MKKKERIADANYERGYVYNFHLQLLYEYVRQYE